MQAGQVVRQAAVAWVHGHSLVPPRQGRGLVALGKILVSEALIDGTEVMAEALVRRAEGQGVFQVLHRGPGLVLGHGDIAQPFIGFGIPGFRLEDRAEVLVGLVIVALFQQLVAIGKVLGAVGPGKSRKQAAKEQKSKF